jgi:uncharacterized membrane-anchored protein YhcB (DUF1043 family)
MSPQTQELMPLIIAIAIILGVIIGATFVVLNTKRIPKQDEEEFANFLLQKELRLRDLQKEAKNLANNY